MSVSLGRGVGVAKVCCQLVLLAGRGIGVIKTWCWCCRDVALVLSRHGVGVVGVVRMWCRCHWDAMLASLRGGVGVGTIRRGTGVVRRQ